MRNPEAIRRRAILEIIKRSGGRMNATTSTHVGSIEAIISGENAGKRIAIARNLVAWREFDSLIIKRPEENAGYRIEIAPRCASIRAGGFAISVERGVDGELFRASLDRALAHNEAQGRDWMACLLNEAELPERLTVRPRLEGERTWVTGQRGIKKLKNIMIDHRIPVSLRASWPVVTTPENLYVWSPGLPPAIRFVPAAPGRKLAIMMASRV